MLFRWQRWTHLHRGCFSEPDAIQVAATDESPSRMLLGTRHYSGGSDGRIAIVTKVAAMDESPSRMLFLRPSRGRAGNATLLRNHHERFCILMTSASLKPVRNHCKTVKRKNAPKIGTRNHHETHDSKKGLMRRFLSPPCHPPKSAKSFRNHHETRNPDARRHAVLHARAPNATPATPDDNATRSLQNHHETPKLARKHQAPRGAPATASRPSRPKVTTLPRKIHGSPNSNSDRNNNSNSHRNSNRNSNGISNKNSNRNSKQQ